MNKVYSTGCVLASVLTIIAAVILLIVGSVYTHDTAFLRDSWSELYALSIFSIVIGALAIIVTIGFLYVVVRQLPALTTLFSCSLLVIAALSIICGGVLIAGRITVRERVVEVVSKLVQNYSSTDDIQNSNLMIDQIQRQFQCCGILKATDWRTQLPNQASTPDSCCRVVVPGCGNDSLVRQDRIYIHGCVAPIYVYFHGKYSALIGVNFTVVALALCTGIAGFIFERSIREQYQLM